MPTYSYKCLECKIVFDVFHSMSETIEECEVCKGPVKKALAGTSRIKRDMQPQGAKPGTLVKKYIQDAKEDLKTERERILQKEFEVK